MKYITNVGGVPLLYGYRKNSYRQRYVTDKLQTYRKELSRQYLTPFFPRRLARYYYLSLLPRAKGEKLADKKHRQDFDDWARLVCQVSMAYSNKCKKVQTKKSPKSWFELIELKTDGKHYEFIIRESVKDNIVAWEYLPDVDTIKQYLKNHPFPKDKLYSEEEFLKDVEKAKGYIHLAVEKRQTAEFICDLCSALI